jgi:hypothetical protein
VKNIVIDGKSTYLEELVLAVVEEGGERSSSPLSTVLMKKSICKSSTMSILASCENRDEVSNVWIDVLIGW